MNRSNPVRIQRFPGVHVIHTCDIGLDFAVDNFKVNRDILLCKKERTRLDYTVFKLNTVMTFPISLHFQTSISEMHIFVLYFLKRGRICTASPAFLYSLTRTKHNFNFNKSQVASRWYIGNVSYLGQKKEFNLIAFQVKELNKL